MTVGHLNFTSRQRDLRAYGNSLLVTVGQSMTKTQRYVFRPLLTTWAEGASAAPSGTTRCSTSLQLHCCAVRRDRLSRPAEAKRENLGGGGYGYASLRFGFFLIFLNLKEQTN